MNLRNPIIIATLLASIGLTAAIPQLPSRVFAAPPPASSQQINRTEEVKRYEDVIRPATLQQDSVAKAGSRVSVSYPTLIPSDRRGFYEITLEGLASALPGKSVETDSLEAYFTQGRLLCAFPERINADFQDTEIYFMQNGVLALAQKSPGYDKIKAAIEDKVNKIRVLHPAVAYVVSKTLEMAQPPEPIHPAFSNEAGYDFSTFVWEGLELKTCGKKVVIKVPVEFEEGADLNKDKAYFCLRYKETIHDPSGKIIQNRLQQPITPRQTEFGAGAGHVEVITKATDKKASLTGRGDVGTDGQTKQTGSDAEVLADLTTRVTTFWNAFKEGSQFPRNKQKMFQDISDCFIPELYEKIGLDQNFILFTFPLGTNPFWNNTLGAYFNGRRIELLINNTGQPTLITSGSPDEINKFIEISIAYNISKLSDNTATSEEIQEVKSRTQESIRAISENAAGLQIERYAFITIPITLDGPDFDKYSKEITYDMRRITVPIFNNNICNFGQLWMQIKGNWYVATTKTFYANFKDYITKSIEDAMDTVYVPNLDKDIYMAVTDNEISFSPTGQQYETRKIGTVFSFNGYYRGEQFREEYRDKTTDKVSMRISPTLHPDDGIPEGYVIEMENDGKPTIYIFLDEDWKREIPNTKIRYGKTFQNTVPVNFDTLTTKKQGVYIIEIDDDPERLTAGYATHHGGVMVGDLRDDDKSTMINFR